MSVLPVVGLRPLRASARPFAFFSARENYIDHEKIIKRLPKFKMKKKQNKKISPMTLSDIYRLAVETGMKNDPRGADGAAMALKETRRKFDDCKDDEKARFDLESLKNPYSDTRILNGPEDAPVDTVLVGIDVEAQELLLADALKGRGARIDAVIAHHPEGYAYARLYDVMHMQSDILGRSGVPINVAESLMDDRVKEVRRRLMPANHQRAVDAAKLLGLPFMCIHTPADNMVAAYLQGLFDAKKPATLGAVVELLLEIEEYKEGERNGAGPVVFVGDKDRTAGRVFVDMTGGTEGSKDIFKSLSLSGINTVVGMHLSEDHRKEAEKQHVNVVIAGHISSDNLGLNLLFDRVCGGSGSSGALKIVGCSGFRRVAR
jgi:hypothetical protein